MPQILIRDVPEQTHANIASAAHAAGRSMQSELLATIQERYATRPARSILEILLSAGGSEAEGELAVVRDTPVRDSVFEDGV